MRSIALSIIRGYQLIVSPMLPTACRFFPTCSHYAYRAVEQHGLVRGGWMAILRLGRCHPFHPGGFDPVPERR